MLFLSNLYDMLLCCNFVKFEFDSLIFLTLFSEIVRPNKVETKNLFSNNRTVRVLMPATIRTMTKIMSLITTREPMFMTPEDMRHISTFRHSQSLSQYSKQSRGEDET